MSEVPSVPRRAAPNARRTLIVMAAIALAPVIASYVAYYLWPREQHVNYGLLLASPAPAIEGTRADGRAFTLGDLHGKWVMIVVSRGACEAACERGLYATRQARTIQGRDQDRVVRLLMQSDADGLDEAQSAQHRDLDVVRVAPEAFGAWPSSDRGIYLVDPLGNLVLAWPPDPDIKALAKDLSRVLRASRIG
jgi:hypothetical protein